MNEIELMQYKKKVAQDELLTLKSWRSVDELKVYKYRQGEINAYDTSLVLLYRALGKGNRPYDCNRNLDDLFGGKWIYYWFDGRVYEGIVDGFTPGRDKVAVIHKGKQVFLPIADVLDYCFYGG